MVRCAALNSCEIKVLGCGANVLVRDEGFSGAVVRLDGPAFREVRVEDRYVRVGAGVDLMPLSRAMCRQGLSGLECMAGIPASVGGAVRMNAGGRHGEFGSVVRSLDVLAPDGRLESWDARRAGFGYRSSSLNGHIVVRAGLELTSEDPAVAEARYVEFLAEKTRSQPLADKSAGCIFKNPNGVSAGALIDRAGLKGLRIGGAEVSSRHANFIIADRSTGTDDVLRLIDLVRERVRAEHNVELETEIDIW